MKERIRIHLQSSIAFVGGVDIVLIYFACWPTDLLPPFFEDSSANPASAFQQRRSNWNSPSALLTVRQARVRHHRPRFLWLLKDNYQGPQLSCGYSKPISCSSTCFAPWLPQIETQRRDQKCC